MNFCYIYRATSYHANVRGRKLGCSMYNEEELGYKYNKEEFLRCFEF